MAKTFATEQTHLTFRYDGHTL